LGGVSVVVGGGGVGLWGWLVMGCVFRCVVV